LSAKGAEAFRHYSWPGNVRELRNVIERAMILEDGDLISVDYLPGNVTASLSQNFKGRTEADLAEACDIVHLPPAGVSIDAVEMALVRQAMERTGGVQKRAAKLLGLTRDRLRYRLKKLGRLPAGNGRPHLN
jgi:DNA-binding NtrC family response regulator